jgi:hypothetical protein
MRCAGPQPNPIGKQWPTWLNSTPSSSAAAPPAPPPPPTWPERGRKVLLLDRPGRIKPCGGAIPPKAIEEFDIPESQLVAKIRSARMVAPSDRHVTCPSMAASSAWSTAALR